MTIDLPEHDKNSVAGRGRPSTLIYIFTWRSMVDWQMWTGTAPRVAVLHPDVGDVCRKGAKRWSE